MPGPGHDAYRGVQTTVSEPPPPSFAAPPGGRPLRGVAGLYALTAAGTAAYWAAFAAGPARTESAPAYLDFERSFPLADAYLAGMSAVAATRCWRGDERAVPVGLMASSASIVVGLLDVLYNARHGKYRAMDGAMATEAAINASMVLGGVLVARRLWGARDRFAAPA